MCAHWYCSTTISSKLRDVEGIALVHACIPLVSHCTCVLCITGSYTYFRDAPPEFLDEFLSNEENRQTCVECEAEYFGVRRHCLSAAYLEKEVGTRRAAMSNELCLHCAAKCERQGYKVRIQFFKNEGL